MISYFLSEQIDREKVNYFVSICLCLSTQKKIFPLFCFHLVFNKKKIKEKERDDSEKQSADLLFELSPQNLVVVHRRSFEMASVSLLPSAKKPIKMFKKMNISRFHSLYFRVGDDWNEPKLEFSFCFFAHQKLNCLKIVFTVARVGWHHSNGLTHKRPA